MLVSSQMYLSIHALESTASDNSKCKIVTNKIHFSSHLVKIRLNFDKIYGKDLNSYWKSEGVLIPDFSFWLKLLIYNSCEDMTLKTNIEKKALSHLLSKKHQIKM